MREGVDAAWLMTVGEVGPRVPELAERLRAEGLSVIGPTAQPPIGAVRLVVVALPIGNLDDFAQTHKTEVMLEPWREQLVPVVDGPRASVAFSDLSQLVVGELGLDEVVRRLQLLHEIGGSTLAALARLESTAQAWTDSGQGRPILLRGAAIDEAKNVVVRGSRVASPEARAFVRASEQARTSRQRLQVLLATLVTLVLVIASGLALVQRQSAVAAQAEAVEKSSVADSERLAGLALDFLGSDPDLPWILVAEAIDSRATPEAIAAARAVTQNIPRHRSILLGALPGALSADLDTGTLAIRFVDGSVEVRSAVDGVIEHRWTGLHSNEPGIALAPGGGLLVVGDQIVDGSLGTSIGNLDGRFAGWIDATRILVIDGETAMILDVVKRSSETLDLTLDTSRGFATSIARGGSVAWILDGDQAHSVDLRSGAALPPVTVPVMGTDIATTDDGSQALVVGPDGAISLARVEGGISSTGARGSGLRVIAAGPNWLVSHSINPVQRVSVETGNVQERFLAHRGGVTGMAALGDGRTATIGTDRYLRLWNSPTQVHYVPDAGPLTEDNFARSGSSLLMTRAQLALAEDGSSLVRADPVSGMASVVDPESLETRSRAFLGMIGQFLPAPRARTVTFGLSRVLKVVDIDELEDVWTYEGLTERADIRLMAVNATGETVALAGASGVDIVHSDGTASRVEYETTALPIWLGFERTMPVVITSAGRIHRDGEAVGTVPGDGSPLAAATMTAHGDIFTVTTDGRLLDPAGSLVARVGSDVLPFAVRAAESGSALAVIGETATVIVDSRTGQFLAEFQTSAPETAVRDVVIKDDSVWLVRADGGLFRHALTSTDDLVQMVRDELPRPATEDESTSLADVVSVIGAD